MKIHAFPLTAALSVALLGACTRPASQVAADTTTSAAAAGQTAGDTAANATNLASDSAAKATDPGGAVSPPASNGALNTDANKNAPNVAAASNSFTESQAKGHIRNAGYSDVTNLTKTPDGLWTATAKKDGKPVEVAVDFKGAVTAK
jgi:hypothetical protein